MKAERIGLERGQTALLPPGMDAPIHLRGEIGLVVPYLILPQSHPQYLTLIDKLKSAEEQGKAFSLHFEPETNTTIESYFHGLSMVDQMEDRFKQLGRFVFVTIVVNRVNAEEKTLVVTDIFDITHDLFEELGQA